MKRFARSEGKSTRLTLMSIERILCNKIQETSRKVAKWYYVVGAFLHLNLPEIVE
jgi:hypothetical protein